MKVVCDNCQAVYKIADHKLVKEINRATCKRCGHKIIIFQHNPASARSTLKGNVSPVTEGASAASAASAEDIEKLAQMTNGGLPSLGSLTKELRAISGPAATPAAVSTPIGPGVGPAVPPAGPATPPTGNRIPGLNPPLGNTTSTDSVTPSNGASQSLPTNPGSSAPGIPASESPDTRVYRGPAPTGPVLSAAAAQSSLATPSVEGDPTRPLPYSAPPAPAVPPPSPIPAPSPLSQSPAPLPQSPSPLPQSPAPSVDPRYPSPVAGAPSNTSVTEIEHQGSPLLGTAGVLGAASFMGLLVLILVPGPLATLGYALAGFGAAGTMALALVTEKGRWPSKMPIGLVLGAAMGLGCAGLALAIEHLDAPRSADVAETTAASSQQAVPAPEAQPELDPSNVMDALPEDGPQQPGQAGPDKGEGSAPSVSQASVSPPRTTRTARASTRSSGPPKLPGLSAEDRAELQSYASKSGDIGSTEPRNSRRSSSSPRSRSVSDKIAKSDSSSSYSGSSKSSRSSKSSSSSTSSSKRRAKPKAPKEKSNSKSSSNAPNQFIIKTIIGSNKSIKRCISSQRSRDPDLSGKIYVKFKISPSGAVSRARVTTSRYAGTALDTCISREVNALQFPPFEGKTQNITYQLLIIGD